MVNARLIGAGLFAIALGLVWAAYLVSEQKHDRIALKLFSVKPNTMSNLPLH